MFYQHLLGWAGRPSRQANLVGGPGGYQINYKLSPVVYLLFFQLLILWTQFIVHLTSLQLSFQYLYFLSTLGGKKARWADGLGKQAGGAIIY